MNADYEVALVLIFFTIAYLVLQIISIPLIRYFKKNYLNANVKIVNKLLIILQFLLLVVMIGILLNEPLIHTTTFIDYRSSEQGPTYFNINYIGIALLHLLLFSITYFYSIHDLKIRKYSKISIMISLIILILIFTYYQYYMAFVYVDMSGG
jgi:hypothetical protein